MGDTLLAVVLGAAFLYAFFRTVQTQWPGSYFVVHPGLLLAATQTPWRFAAFRLGPVFVTSIFVAVSVMRSDGDALAAVLGLAAAHICLTTARGIWRQMAGMTASNPSLLIFYVGVSIAVVLVAYCGYLAASPLKALVPPVDEISASLWTALLAGIIGAFLVRVSRRTREDDAEPFRESKRRLDSTLWSAAEREALANGADPVLVQAIMLVENLERPGWARSLERAKGKLRKKGTYGVMQVSADRPISDLESIKRAVQHRLAGVVVTDPVGSPVQLALEAIARSYNPDENYVDAVVRAYEFVLQEQRRWHGDLEDCPDCQHPNAYVQRQQRLDGEGNVIVDIVSSIVCRNPACNRYQAPAV